MTKTPARATIAGYEATAMISNRQVHEVGRRNIRAQASVIAKLLEIAA